jgi:glycosyltransferase involved in cell wall biosynthesis
MPDVFGGNVGRPHILLVWRQALILGDPTIKMDAKEVCGSYRGFEVAKLREIGYGAALDPESAKMMKWIFANASKVLTVDESLKREAIRNLGASESNITTIPTGYDSNKFRPHGRKENIVLTVGSVGESQSPRRKGLDVFVRAAQHAKEFSFVHVGELSGDDLEDLKQATGQNVSFVGKVTDTDLLKHYQRAGVYC